MAMASLSHGCDHSRCGIRRRSIVSVFLCALVILCLAGSVSSSPFSSWFVHRRALAGGHRPIDETSSRQNLGTANDNDNDHAADATLVGEGEELIEEDWDRWALIEADLGLDEYGFNVTAEQRKAARRFLGLASLLGKKSKVVKHVTNLVQKAFGYGALTIGGFLGPRATVTSFGDSGPGSLRSLCARPGPLYIRFARDGVIRLKSRVECGSHKTIDGAGRRVRITGWGIHVVRQSHVIIKNLCIAGVKEDAITVRSSSNVWIDRVSVTNVGDGGIDVIWGSRAVTISHSHFYGIWKTLLLGNGNSPKADKAMTVTVAFNWFQGCLSRTPRVRTGKVHVCNNVYDKWVKYAVGASDGASVLVENNFFVKGVDPFVNNLHEGEHDGTTICYRSNVMEGAKLLRQAVGVVSVPFTCPRRSAASIRSSAGCGFQCAA
ncbi:hypothetical protein CBR_g12052 [Chara braunii]|uniref:Pectate lyase domain-containing protein n=1 Tax=Chara braunii TaxID=69332 RepID=A0A388KR13_CHABU|nr:hypothetical protein CBR_g12052 [Chara braunii]|eukprot:GBG72477.1 hypothetical protein CBR_g12052 [Chara braunii]